MLRGLARRAGNHGHLPVQPCRQGGDRSVRPAHSACSRLPFYSHHSRSIPLFSRDILGIRRTVREIDLLDLIAGSEQVEEDRLVHSFLTEFKVVSMNRRFCAVVRRYVVPGTAGGQDVQDTVEQPAGVTSGSADMRLRWRKGYFRTISQRSSSISRKNHASDFYLKDLIFLGSPLWLRVRRFTWRIRRISPLKMA